MSILYRDKEKSLELYKNNKAREIFNDAMNYSMQEKRMKILTEAAELQYPTAEYYLAIEHLDNIEEKSQTKENRMQGLGLLLKAASNHYPKAIWRLGEEEFINGKRKEGMELIKESVEKPFLTSEVTDSDLIFRFAMLNKVSNIDTYNEYRNDLEKYDLSKMKKMIEIGYEDIIEICDPAKIEKMLERAGNDGCLYAQIELVRNFIREQKDRNWQCSYHDSQDMIEESYRYPRDWAHKAECNKDFKQYFMSDSKFTHKNATEMLEFLREKEEYEISNLGIQAKEM